MSDLSVDDFKNILLDLYLAQRENAVLRAALMQDHADEDRREAPEGVS